MSWIFLRLCGFEIVKYFIEHTILKLFRHGDRTPAKAEAAYVCEPTPDMYHPVGFENLTNVSQFPDKLNPLNQGICKHYDIYFSRKEDAIFFCARLI